MKVHLLRALFLGFIGSFVLGLLVVLSAPEAYAAGGVETRTVICKDSFGNTVADIYCAGPKPAVTQPSAVCAPATVCGSANGTTVTSQPTANLCSDASAPTVTAKSDGTGWTWICDINSCAATRRCTPGTEDRTIACPFNSVGTITQRRSTNLDGACNVHGEWAETANSCVPVTCGSANTIASVERPASNLCNNASAPEVTQSGPNTWVWVCGANTCTAPRTCNQQVITQTVACPANQTGSITQQRTLNQSNVCGSDTAWADTANSCTSVGCGSANGISSIERPSANLCSDGSTPSVTQSGVSLWAWACGANTCTAPKNNCGNTAANACTSLCSDSDAPAYRNWQTNKWYKVCNCGQWRDVTDMGRYGNHFQPTQNCPI